MFLKTKSLKVVLAGGTGEIGQVLEKEYLRRGYELLILTRKPQKDHHIYWDALKLDLWCQELEACDLLINLCGQSILSHDRQKIYDSRLQPTRLLGQAIEQLRLAPRLWLNMSSTGIYGHRMEGFDKEKEGVIDSSPPPSYWAFMTQLIQDWEQALSSAPCPKTRKIVLRMSFFMSVNPKGFFGICSRLAKKGLGGSLGGGEQFISWIHETDLLAGIDLILKDSSIESPVNFCSPHPLAQKDLMRILREQWKIPFGLPVGKRILKIMNFFGGVSPDLVLKSSKAYPQKLLNHGFQFQYPHWKQASKELVQRYT